MAKNCKKGASCKLTCIEKKDTCRKQLPANVSKFLTGLSEKLGEGGSNLSVENPELVEALKKIDPEKQAFIAEMAVLIMGRERSKADKFAFSESELKGMQSRAKELDSAYEVSFRKDGATPESLRAKGGINDYLQKYRTQKVSDDDVEAMWEVLPSKYRSSLTAAGALKKGNFWKGDSLDEEATPDPAGGNPSAGRAKLLLKLYMRQGGRDIYTGQPLPLMEADLEHVIPFELGGKTSEDPANWGWTRTGINAGRGKKDLKEYIEKSVSKRLGLSGIEDDPEGANAKNLAKVRKDFEKVQKQNRLKRQSKKDLESADWLTTPSSSWSKEQNEIFDRMNSSLNDKDIKKGYYLIEKILPDFSSTASIHPIKRSSRRKVWLQELGSSFTEESLNMWKEADSGGKKRIETFWRETGPEITEKIKAKGLYKEETSKEAMALAKEIVKEKIAKLKG